MALSRIKKVEARRRWPDTTDFAFSCTKKGETLTKKVEGIIPCGRIKSCSGRIPLDEPQTKMKGKTNDENNKNSSQNNTRRGVRSGVRGVASHWRSCATGEGRTIAHDARNDVRSG